MRLVQAYLNWLNKRKFRNLITAGIALMLFPILVSGITSLYTTDSLGNEVDALEVRAKLIQDAGELRYLTQAARVSVYRLIYFNDESQIKTFQQLDSKASALLKELRSGGADPKLLDNIESMQAAYSKALDPVFKNYRDRRYVQAQLPKTATLGDSYADAVQDLANLLDKDIANAGKQADTVAARANTFTILAILMALVFAATVNTFTRFIIIKPFVNLFARLIDTSKRLADSSQSLSSNAESIRLVTTQISSAVGQVATGATDQSKHATDAASLVDQISTAINQVADGAQAQATSVNETVSGITQLVGSIDKVSNAAQLVAEVVDSASTVASRGKEAVEETVSGMQKIKETVLDSATKIQTLGEKSKQIGEIIEVIDDIAEQTNLLALNAAIEAARAGEHGKGFAVVADEVRKLAERSAKATGEIAELIKGIQDETMDAVSAMEKGTSEVEAGSELAINAGGAIEEMMGSIRQVVAQISQVAENATEMASSSTQVSQAIEQIAAISEQSSSSTQEVAASTNQVVSAIDSIAAASEEAAASAEEVSASAQEQAASIEEITGQVEALATMANGLDELVKKFNV